MDKAPPATDDAIRNVFEIEETVSDWDDEYYHPIAVKYYDEAIVNMLKTMGATPGQTVLDAGCGPGVHSIRAANYGCKVEAIDLSEKMLSHAKARAADAGVSDKINFSQNDLTKLTLESNSYPFVFNWGVVIHIPDTQAALENLVRIVAPGGKLALQISNQNSLDFFIEKIARKLLSKPLSGAVEKPLGAGTWYDYQGEKLWVLRFNTKALIDLMAKSGLRLIDRRAAEYTEIQWRTGGFIRTLLLLGNRIAYKLRFPAAFSCTQILIFEKETY